MFIFDQDKNSDNGCYRFSLSNNAQYLDAFKKGTQNEQYLATPDESASLPQYYEIGNNVSVEPRVVEISSFIKTPTNAETYVVYSIYDTDVATVHGIPYSADIDFSSYSKTTVPLKATAYNAGGYKVAEKTYYIKVD